MHLNFYVLTLFFSTIQGRCFKFGTKKRVVKHRDKDWKYGTVPENSERMVTLVVMTKYDTRVGI